MRHKVREKLFRSDVQSSSANSTTNRPQIVRNHFHLLPFLSRFWLKPHHSLWRKFQNTFLVWSRWQMVETGRSQIISKKPSPMEIVGLCHESFSNNFLLKKWSLITKLKPWNTYYFLYSINMLEGQTWVDKQHEVKETQEPPQICWGKNYESKSEVHILTSSIAVYHGEDDETGMLIVMSHFSNSGNERLPSIVTTEACFVQGRIQTSYSTYPFSLSFHFSSQTFWSL